MDLQVYDLRNIFQDDRFEVLQSQDSVDYSRSYMLIVIKNQKIYSYVIMENDIIRLRCVID